MAEDIIDHSARREVQMPYDAMLSIVEPPIGVDRDINYLPRLTSVLAGIRTTLITFPSSHAAQELWNELNYIFDEIRTLLTDFHRNLLRAMQVDDECYSFTPHKYTAKNDKVPGYFDPILREFRLCLRGIILALKGTHDTNGQDNSFVGQIKAKEFGQCRSEARRLLDNMITKLLPRRIYETHLDTSAPGLECLDVMQNATAQRYRLVDCKQLTSNGVLCIDEFTEFPHFPYVAISYVWKGNPTPAGYEAKEFSVSGAEDADNIGFEVLYNACVAALARGATHLWIDRLCIMQNNRMDKSWQISKMYRMYRCCIQCIVVPGGLRRLVTSDMDTDWIHRGWTLQEALAPPSVCILLSWEFGRGKACVGDGGSEDVEEVTPGQSAVMPLSLLLDASHIGQLSFRCHNSPEDKIVRVIVKTFSIRPSNQDRNAASADQQTSHIKPPIAAALAVAMSKDANMDVKHFAIWQSALMRTSSRPVDMVFSIMALFGIILDANTFEADDRIAATIALARRILEDHGRANWLGVSPRIAPCRYLSTFPTFPQTRVAGKALMSVDGVNEREVSEIMESEYPIAHNRNTMPKGCMDVNGYLYFDAKAVRISPGSVNGRRCFPASVSSYNPSRPETMMAMDGSIWKAFEGQYDANPTTEMPRTFMILLGIFASYQPIEAPTITGCTIRAMLAQEHARGKFHLRSYFILDGSLEGWVLSWPTQRFCIGGPEILENNAISDDEAAHQLQSLYTENPSLGRLTPRILTRLKSKPSALHHALQNARDRLSQG